MGFKFAIAVACVCVGALTLAGCNRDQASNQQPAAPGAAAAGGQQTGTAMPPAGDLSPESNQKFLADNSKMTGVTVRPSGLQYRVIKAGAGKSPTPNDQVTVTYKGSLITGQVFDQTEAGQTATFPAGQLIPGWVEALQLMKKGDEWEIVIPSGLAYGEQGAGGVIPPNQTLVFQMSLMKVDPLTPPP